MSAQETGRQVNGPKKYHRAVKSSTLEGAVGRGVALKQWLKACEAVKKKYRNETGFKLSKKHDDITGVLSRDAFGPARGVP